MKESRHPHPHLDPRQPRHGSSPSTNPPVFAWRPRKQDSRFRLTVARDPALKLPMLDVSDLADAVFLPAQAFPAGTCAGEPA